VFFDRAKLNVALARKTLEKRPKNANLNAALGVDEIKFPFSRANEPIKRPVRRRAAWGNKVRTVSAGILDAARSDFARKYSTVDS